MVMDTVTVKYQDDNVGALSFDTDTGIGEFEYASSFISSGRELSPLMMPLSDQINSFAAIDRDVFNGLPGLVADSLPDDFGNAVLNSWIARQGKSPADITPLERLRYTGKRGMGALTYSPARRQKGLNASQQVAIESLVEIAQDILTDRQNFEVTMNKSGKEDVDAMMALMSVGTSAGGARPKAVVAFNNDFTEVRSGQVKVPEGFTHYLLKFDGVSEKNTSKETFGDPKGYGTMEYTYYQMATACGINMMPCRLFDEGRRRHFITQRFDRDGNDRIHMQTLNAIAHVSYKRPGEYSYEALFSLARQLGLSPDEAKQLFRRMVFNIVARNHDDHSKNFAFMMDDSGQWSLSPAYDVAYSYAEGNRWTDVHWMALNGRRDHYTRDDLHALSAVSPLFTKKFIDETIEETEDSVSRWRTLATDNSVPDYLIQRIEPNLRLDI